MASRGVGGCEFCTKMLCPQTRSGRYDFHILDSTPHFEIIAALGALVPGHVLIVSRRHASSVASLDPPELSELAVLIEDWASRIASKCEIEALIFEHGMRSGAPAMGCIEHAHVQLMPWQELRGLTEPTDRAVTGVLELPSAVAGGGGYLLVGRTRKAFLRSDAGLNSQHFRRAICKAQGRSAEWDYLLYPNHDAMDETMRLLGCRGRCSDPQTLAQGSELEQGLPCRGVK